jgi:hypothetical protein
MDTAGRPLSRCEIAAPGADSKRQPLRHGMRRSGELEPADRHATVDHEHVTEDIARLCRAQRDGRDG